MRSELLREIAAFAESRRAVAELEVWWLEHAHEVETNLGRFAYLLISKRRFAGLRAILEKEGLTCSPSCDHCQGCGEPFFVVMPDVTTRAQIVAFAQSSKLKIAQGIVADGWLHPGQYCKNGCTFRLWNLR